MNFSHEGKNLSTIVGCVIRSVQSPDAPKDSPMILLAYAISPETSQEHRDSLPPVIHAVAKSIQFTDARRPVDIPLAKGTVLKDETRGFSIDLPAGWVSREKPETRHLLRPVAGS